MRISVINGPNLNLIGTRQPEIYGSESLADLEAKVDRWATKMGVEVEFLQSNDESELVEAVQAAANVDGVVINPGGFTHTSVAIADAVASIDVPVVEVHLSNIHGREAFRRKSLIEPVAVRQISGRGSTGYRDALRHLLVRAASPYEPVRYGPHPRNVADFRRPEGEPKASVVLVHGGFWYPGWDRDQLDAIAADLTGRGFATYNIGYRLDPPWPASGHDVETGIRSVGYAQPLVVLGHSAGAYLALWAARRVDVDLCVCLAPVTDLELVEDVTAVEIMRQAGAPAKVEATPDCVVFHGEDDTEVSPRHSTRLKPGPTMLAGVGHFDLVNPQRDHWPQIVSAIESRLR